MPDEADPKPLFPEPHKPRTRLADVWPLASAHETARAIGEAAMSNRPDFVPPPPQNTASPMHPKDRRFWVVLGIWAAIAVGALSTGIGAFISGSPHWGAGLCAVGFVGAVMATLHLLETKRSALRYSHVNFLMALVALITWAFIGWQTWIWLHPSTQTIQGYTQAQRDDDVVKAKEATAKPLRAQIDQLNTENDKLRQGNAAEIAKATAALRAQVAQLQSNAPINVDKLPTSLRLFFKADGTAEGTDLKNVLWTPIYTWHAQQSLLVRPLPGWTIVMVFKKPIAYKELCFDPGDTGIAAPTSEKNPHYAVVQFDAGGLYGLINLYAANECKAK